MDDESIGRIRQVEKIAREERLDCRQQVNRIKSGAVYPSWGQSVRLQGLKAWRQAAGLSERDLAKMIGTKQTTISELEKRYGRGAYPFMIRRLCEALKVSPADLICKYEVSEEGTEGAIEWRVLPRRRAWNGRNS